MKRVLVAGGIFMGVFGSVHFANAVQVYRKEQQIIQLLSERERLKSMLQASNVEA
ncbi:hypothetical protein HDU81_000959 [Chytriomyces hyalinus]|nr:hypothetical protein HDU81_000959 [Chytriomyces hyalinus]